MRLTSYLLAISLVVACNNEKPACGPDEYDSGGRCLAETDDNDQTSENDTSESSSDDGTPPQAPDDTAVADDTSGTDTSINTDTSEAGVDTAAPESTSCGDGYYDPFIGEECDDGNTASNDGCSDTCTRELTYDTCAGITYAGCCDGEVLLYCLETTGLAYRDCSSEVSAGELLTCGLDSEGGNNTCLRAIDIPTDVEPVTCPTVSFLDADGDGYSIMDGDCMDTNPSIHPGAEDLPDDGIDADCSGSDTYTPHSVAATTLFGYRGEASHAEAVSDLDMSVHFNLWSREALAAYSLGEPTSFEACTVSVQFSTGAPLSWTIHTSPTLSGPDFVTEHKLFTLPTDAVFAGAFCDEFYFPSGSAETFIQEHTWTIGVGRELHPDVLEYGLAASALLPFYELGHLFGGAVACTTCREDAPLWLHTSGFAFPIEDPSTFSMSSEVLSRLMSATYSTKETMSLAEFEFAADNALFLMNSFFVASL